MTVRPLAHSANQAGHTHDLEKHLRDVAELAAEYAEPFQSAGYARCAGLWHDLGKNAPDFQAKLDPDAHIETSPGRVDHSSAGAIHAINMLQQGRGLPVAFVIGGHHAGLADLLGSNGLSERLTDPAKRERLRLALEAVGAVIPSCAPPVPPPFLTGLKQDPVGRRKYEFWVRMLFSCLVDADFLDTEWHFNSVKGDARGQYPSLAQLKPRFDGHMDRLAGNARPGTVADVRARILADCRDRGRVCPPGVFTLTAPTGAGKTLAGMAFALGHAVARGRRRVIVVIPYTSIIDQNAKVYRQVFGPDNVIDHHASLDPAKETHRNRIACENWDAPVVVTTSVQFVETLFANRTSKCRKLHNIADSVVIFDEVQTLPIGHLIPIVDVLKELVAHYGVTLVLSTATQPALTFRHTGSSQVFPGFDGVTEIVSDVPAAFARLRRVDVHWPADLAAPVTWERLAKEIGARDEVLAIVHRRDDARELAGLIPESIHLSALMCPAHRLRVIQDIKKRLEANRGRRDRDAATEPVRVISTQLVEAGVDLDFPVVYRALGGFDSIAQAAGRCNREGRLGRGEVRVFVAPTRPPRGTPRAAQEVAVAMLSGQPDLDILDPAVYDPYFRQLYLSHQPDPAGIQSLRAEWKFRTLAETFSMIEDDGSEPVVVPYGEAPVRVEALRKLGASRDQLRALQPFVVTVYPNQLKALEAAGAIELVADTVWAITMTHESLYDKEKFGLILDGPSAADPAKLMC